MASSCELLHYTNFSLGEMLQNFIIAMTTLHSRMVQRYISRSLKRKQERKKLLFMLRLLSSLHCLLFLPRSSLLVFSSFLFHFVSKKLKNINSLENVSAVKAAAVSTISLASRHEGFSASASSAVCSSSIRFSSFFSRVAICFSRNKHFSHLNRSFVSKHDGKEKPEKVFPLNKKVHLSFSNLRRRVEGEMKEIFHSTVARLFLGKFRFFGYF